MGCVGRWRYTTRVAPLQTLGEGYGHNYTMALLTSTEAQAFLSHCDGLVAQSTEGNETAALDACLHDEVRRRSQELEAAGDRGLYLHVQVWRRTIQGRIYRCIHTHIS